MTEHSPVLCGDELIRTLEKSGAVVLRQKGSHVAMERKTVERTYRFVVPRHTEIKRGTLRNIVRQAGLSMNEFRELLKDFC